MTTSRSNLLTSSLGSVLLMLSFVLGCAPSDQGPGAADTTDITPSVSCDAGCPAGYVCERGVCVGGDHSALVIDVPVVAVSGTVTANGQPLTAGLVTSANDVFIRVVFTDLATGVVSYADDWHFGAAPGAFSGAVRPGTYRVSCLRNYVDGVPELPSGQVLLASSLTITGPTSELTFDVPVVAVSGMVTANGQPLTQGLVTSANDVFIRVVLTDLDTGVVSFIDDWRFGAAPGAFAGLVRTGRYSVSAARNYIDGVPELPSGQVLLAASLTIDGPTNELAFDVPVVAVSGMVTANGQPLTQGLVTSANDVFIRVVLTELETNVVSFIDDWRFGAAPGAFAGVVRPGTYRVSAVRNYVDGVPELPSGEVLLASSLTISGPSSDLLFDVPTVAVSGSVTANGQPLTQGLVTSANDVFIRVLLTDLETNVVSVIDDWRFGAAPGAFAGIVRPGTYRVSAMRNYVDGVPELPSGQVVLASSLTITEATNALSFDVPTVAIAGLVTANGQALTQGLVTSANDVFIRLSLTDIATGVISFVDDWRFGSPPGAFSGVVRSGTYRVSVGRNYVDGVPELPSGQTLLSEAVAF